MTDVIVECADVHSETYCSLGVFSTNLVNLVPSPKSNIYDGVFYFYPLIISAKTDIWHGTKYATGWYPAASQFNLS